MDRPTVPGEQALGKRFDAALVADHRIELREGGPVAYRNRPVRQIVQHAHVGVGRSGIDAGVVLTSRTVALPDLVTVDSDL